MITPLVHTHTDVVTSARAETASMKSDNTTIPDNLRAPVIRLNRKQRNAAARTLGEYPGRTICNGGPSQSVDPARAAVRQQLERGIRLFCCID